MIFARCLQFCGNFSVHTVFFSVVVMQRRTSPVLPYVGSLFGFLCCCGTDSVLHGSVPVPSASRVKGEVHV